MSRPSTTRSGRALSNNASAVVASWALTVAAVRPKLWANSSRSCGSESTTRTRARGTGEECGGRVARRGHAAVKPGMRVGDPDATLRRLQPTIGSRVEVQGWPDGSRGLASDACQVVNCDLHWHDGCDIGADVRTRSGLSAETRGDWSGWCFRRSESVSVPTRPLLARLDAPRADVSG